MAKEIPEAAAHSHRFPLSTLNFQLSISATWLCSFPTVQLRPKQSDGELQRISEWDRFWPCRANWEAAKLYSLKVSCPAWEAALPFPALPLRLCTNIETGDCLFITLIFFAWR